MLGSIAEVQTLTDGCISGDGLVIISTFFSLF